MATVLIGFLNLFKTMGFGAVVVQRREISNTLLSSLFYVNIVVACVLALLAVGAAPICAWLYQDSRVSPIIAIMSVNFILSASAVVPSALLTRQMSFDRLAIANVAGVLVSGSTAISLAFAGYGVLALVAGSIAGTLIDTILCNALCSWHPQLIFRWSEVRSVINFGVNITGFNFFNYFARSADTAIIGTRLGAQALGFYSLAYSIMLRPRDTVTNVLGRVLFPTLSQIQHDDVRLKAAILRACGAIAFVTFPMMLGLLVVARPFVEVVLGAKWLPAVPLIMILSPLGAIQSIGEIAGYIFLVKNRSDWYFRWGAVTCVAYVCCFFAGLPWNAIGVAVSYLFTSSILTVFGLRIAFRFISKLAIRDLGAELWPYAVQSGIMAILVTLCHAGMETLLLDPSIALIVSVAIGIAAYTAMSFMFRPPALIDLFALLPGQWAARLGRSLAE
jgi:O-antigen/teichoic acid export membrane protein